MKLKHEKNNSYILESSIEDLIERTKEIMKSITKFKYDPLRDKELFYNILTRLLANDIIEKNKDLINNLTSDGTPIMITFFIGNKKRMMVISRDLENDMYLYSILLDPLERELVIDD